MCFCGQIRCAFRRIHKEMQKRTKYRSHLDRFKCVTGRGEMNMCVDDLRILYLSQNGRCAVSNQTMVFESSQHETLSPDRLRNDVGYVPTNIVFVCAMFNNAARMTAEKYYYILYHSDLPGIPPDVKRTFVRILAKLRGRDPDTDLTCEYLYHLYAEQRGLCAYSGVRMNVGPNQARFQLSVERLNRSVGYRRGNVCLIILELNIGGQVGNLSKADVERWRTLTTNTPYTVHGMQVIQDAWACMDATKVTLICDECVRTLPDTLFRDYYGIRRSRCRTCINREHYSRIRKRLQTVGNPETRIA